MQDAVRIDVIVSLWLWEYDVKNRRIESECRGASLRYEEKETKGALSISLATPGPVILVELHWNYTVVALKLTHFQEATPCHKGVTAVSHSLHKIGGYILFWS